METLKTINFVIAVIFFVCYTYQFLYIPVPWLRKARPHGPAKDNRYAVLICARNEQRVIGDLIASLRGQTYSQGLLSIFVLADNCTDDTAMVARVAGANVYERFNQVQVGKGYALQELLEHLEQDYPQGFDGYFVFDADNILAPNYVEAMNRTFSDGHDIVTSFRNSKNYGDNWISAGYALWFLRESRYLNHARFLLGTSCAVSGTGFLFSRRVLEETGPWPFHLLTEDIQFSVDQVTRGRKIAFCPEAVLYDEQPTTFRQSWNQRLRWSKGYLQVFRGYGAKLLRGAAGGELLLLRHGGGHYAGLRPVGHGHRLQRDGGHSGGRPRGGPDHCPVVRGADAAEYVSDPVCAGGHHHRYRVEAHPYQGGEEGPVRLHLPAVYVYLYSHLLCGAVQQGGVEAHRAPGQRRVPAGPGPGGAAALLTGSLPPVQSEK